VSLQVHLLERVRDVLIALSIPTIRVLLRIKIVFCTCRRQIFLGGPAVARRGDVSN
jgi:hypothetical protein